MEDGKGRGGRGTMRASSFGAFVGGEDGGKRVRGGCTIFRVYEEARRNDAGS